MVYLLKNKHKYKKDMSKFTPFVSIIIPIYNGSNYMREAIDSALAQTYKNIEIIVVNDGSTDSTEQIAKSYGDKIRYYKKENGGVATALNLAIKKSKGEYISWLSHDDMYYSDKIEKQIKKLSKLNKKERINTIVYSNYALINEESEITSKQSFEKIHNKEKLNYPAYPILKGLIHGCTLLIPRKCFNEVGFFDEKLKITQDYDLWFKMFPKYKLLFMPNLFVKSRWHREQGSKKIDKSTEEVDELWIRMIEGLSDEEKIEISESMEKFYIDSYSMIKLNKLSKKTQEYLWVKIKSYVGLKRYFFYRVKNYSKNELVQFIVQIKKKLFPGKWI